MVIKKRKIDNQGRISLPSGWRKKHTSKEIVIVEDGDTLIIIPKTDPDLSKYINSVKADVPVESYSDYHELKKYLLSRE